MRAVEPLIAALKDGDNSVRLDAAYSLGTLGDKRAVEPLIACLKAKDVHCAYAAEALGNLGDERAVEPLIACLESNNVDHYATMRRPLASSTTSGPWAPDHQLERRGRALAATLRRPLASSTTSGPWSPSSPAAGLARQGCDWQGAETTRRQACDGQGAILLSCRRTGRQGLAGRLEANQATDLGRRRLTRCEKSAERPLYGDCSGQRGHAR